MPSVKAWTFGEAGAPFFPNDYEIVKKAVLQVTDIKTNHNKYYGIELHVGKHKGKELYRVFTHYGRTDDLEMNEDAGQKEVRYFPTMALAEGAYQSIYREKTSARKGYKEVALASSKIGSQKARGTSSGEMDAATLEKTAEGGGGKKKKAAVAVVKKKAAPKASALPAALQALIRYLYDEAKDALTTRVAAKITAKGIETPLGVLTLGQIDKGEEILEELFVQFKKKKKDASEMERLSSEFYTAIPHRIGRSRSAVQDAIIDTLEEFHQKQETLQLMKDMLQVNGEGGNVLYDAHVDAEYDALGCKIEALEKKDKTYREIADYVVDSQVKIDSIEVHNVYTLKRDKEWKDFASKITNQKLLFHGSNIRNWVGILSRGILLPKIVVSLGVDRTDEGWLGSGIYFGDASCTSAFYASSGRKGTSFIAIARVALGKVKDFHEITYGITKPPTGHHSCHGVRCTDDVDSEFDDDEFVIYQGNQQRLEYLVEITT
jgi:poly [ADP-ribose] polymerase